jgi:hypothetical protein
MILTLFSFRYPDLCRGVHTVLQALLLTVALVAAVALCVAVLVAVAPHLPTIAAAAAIIGGYAMLTQPRSKAARA